MAKVRVYELAKELGVDSRVLMSRLQEIGEFVRSASSTIEPGVVRRLRNENPGLPLMGGAGEVASREPTAARLQGRPVPLTGRPSANPFSVQRQAQRSAVGRDAGAVRRQREARARADAEEVFGHRAVRATTRGGTEQQAWDGYGWSWQKHVISRETYLEFAHAGVGAHEADLAYECLMAGLRPADLLTRLGDRTVLEWVRGGEPAAKVAGTLAECRRDPKSRHLVAEPRKSAG